MSALVCKILIVLLYSVVVFLIGFSVGNIKAQHKNLEKELIAAADLFRVQGDKPEQIKATLELMKINSLKEIGGAKRQILSIWLPSILVIVNIILTIVLKGK